MRRDATDKSTARRDNLIFHRGLYSVKLKSPTQRPPQFVCAAPLVKLDRDYVKHSSFDRKTGTNVGTGNSA